MYLESLLSQHESYSYGEFEFNEILNFNFTPPISPDHNQSKTKYIHGSIKDKGQCIFGYDDFISLHSMDRDVQQDNYKKNRRYELSKQYQLFELNKAKSVLKLGDIFNLSILGHSIGRQDYQYYFAILDHNSNREKIILDVYWYKYEDDEGHLKDNYEMMKKALFQMLQEYENRNGSRIVDKLLFERRIHFIEYHLEDSI